MSQNKGFALWFFLACCFFLAGLYLIWSAVSGWLFALLTVFLFGVSFLLAFVVYCVVDEIIMWVKKGKKTIIKDISLS